MIFRLLYCITQCSPNYKEAVMTPFGESLEILRKHRGFTQVQLAEKASITSNYLSMLERGTKGPPSEETLAKLADALELSLDERKLLFYDAKLVQFSLKVPAGASRDEYEMVQMLQSYLGTLTTKQVQLMELAMSIKTGIKQMVGDSKMNT